MNNYVNAELEIVAIATQDTITTSNVTPDNNELPLDPA